MANSRAWCWTRSANRNWAPPFRSIQKGSAAATSTERLLTDQNGVFALQRLRPGLYAVKVTQAGFLPSMQQHIRVGAGLTTLVRIEMDSVFSSLNQLRRQPSQSTEADDWKWVLRTSSATRPVLQFRDGTVVVAGGVSSSVDASADASPAPGSR